MHRCLQIYEILELVLDSVYYQHHKEFVDKPNLLALLKTCRYFSEAATKLLWQNLESLGPLIATMPEDLVEITKTPGKSEHRELRYVTFRREVIPSDWERFDLYAPLVKAIGDVARQGRFLPTAKFILDSAVARGLQRKLGGKYLLPNLTMLADPSGNPSITRQLLTPRINTLNINPDFSWGAESICRFIADIPVLAPSLKSLRLARFLNWGNSSPVEENLLILTLSKVLENMDLEEFSCSWLVFPQSVIEMLVRKPNFHRIGIVQDTPTLWKTLDLFPPKEPRFKEVIIWAYNDGLPSQLPQILVSLRPSLLELFRFVLITSTISFTQDELDRLISTVAKHCSPKFLRSFSIDDCRDSKGFIPALASVKLFRPLFAFTNLRKLCLGVHPDFNDAEVKELAMAWPLMEELEIEPSTTLPASIPPRTTLRCLLWFAIYCRNLKDLSFCFQGMDTFSEAELATAANNMLECLSVGYSADVEVEGILHFFEIVFPRLDSLDYNDNAISQEDMDTWTQISGHVHAKYRERAAAALPM